jgi:hypothetical protein
MKEAVSAQHEKTIEVNVYSSPYFQNTTGLYVGSTREIMNWIEHILGEVPHGLVC